MRRIRFTSTTRPDLGRLCSILDADPEHPHIHTVDMPYRLTSTWQDQGCELGVWEEDDNLLAWAVYQPPWWNLDYALAPAEHGSPLERDVLTWGRDQMLAYAGRTGDEFWGSVELFEDALHAEETIGHLRDLGFQEFDWSTLRFGMNLDQELPDPQLPEGFRLRPLRGVAEVEAYVSVHRAAFGSDKMTEAWRERILAHPAYRPEIDLVVANPDDDLVGFCICWVRHGVGQIEPLGVHPAYQGEGLGKALEQAGLRAMQKCGAKSVWVDHVNLNEQAIALSLRSGFRRVNNARRFYIEAGDRQ